MSYVSQNALFFLFFYQLPPFILTVMCFAQYFGQIMMNISSLVAEYISVFNPSNLAVFIVRVTVLFLPPGPVKLRSQVIHITSSLVHSLL